MEIKEIPKCEIELIKVDGVVKVKATCEDEKDAFDLKDILDGEPLIITVKPKTKIETVPGPADPGVVRGPFSERLQKLIERNKAKQSQDVVSDPPEK